MMIAQKTASTLAFFMLFCSTSRAQPAGQPHGSKDAIAIQTVLAQVRDALVRCQRQLKGKKLPPLQSIDLTLQTVAEKDAGGTFKLLVISLGAKRAKEETQEVIVHLTPPSADNPTKVGATSLTEALENAIVSAAEGAQNAGTKEYPLIFSGLTVNLSFVVKTTGSAGISVELLPVTFELTGQVAKNAAQTIKLVFQDPKKPGAA
jgi:NTP-dependent ternary system trypsin peptidase co-occuring protein